MVSEPRTVARVPPAVPRGPVLRELRPRDTEEQVRRMVDLRMQRQRLLDQDPPLEAWIILDEGAIRRNIGGEAIMRHQLEHLIKASR